MNCKTRSYSYFLLLILFSFGCAIEPVATIEKQDVPTRNHDLGYIPFEPGVDDTDFIVCDPTNFISGRNRIQYEGGNSKLQEDIYQHHLFKKNYELFTGYLVVRFLVNCEGVSGRYRAQALNLDFSPSSAPSGMTDYTIDLIKSLDNWSKSPGTNNKLEYMKYVNFKIVDGKIEHVLL